MRTHDVKDVPAARQRLGMPERLGSCHTAKVAGYVVEGHVPAADIQRLLKEKPKALGIAVPSMPPGSPGMESPQTRFPTTRCWSSPAVKPASLPNIDSSTGETHENTHHRLPDCLCLTLVPFRSRRQATMPAMPWRCTAAASTEMQMVDGLGQKSEQVRRQGDTVAWPV